MDVLKINYDDDDDEYIGLIYIYYNYIADCYYVCDFNKLCTHIYMCFKLILTSRLCLTI